MMENIVRSVREARAPERGLKNEMMLYSENVWVSKNGGAVINREGEIRQE